MIVCSIFWINVSRYDGFCYLDSIASKVIGKELDDAINGQKRPKFIGMPYLSVG